MKRLVVATSALGDNGRIFLSQLSSIEIEAEKHGVQVNRISLDSTKGFAEFLRSLNDDDTLVYSGIWGFDQSVGGFSKLGLAKSAQRDLFTDSNCTLVATICDHPFSNFMIDRISSASKEFIYLLQEPSNLRAAKEISTKELKCVDANSVLCPALDTTQLPDYQSRPISIFFPMATHSNRVDVLPFLRSLPSDLAKIVSLVHDEYRFEFGVTIYEFLREQLPSNIPLGELKSFVGDIVYTTILCILSDGDVRERARWRLDRLNAVCSLEKAGTIVVAGQRPTEDADFGANVHFAGGHLDFSQIVQLYANSKLVYHCHPTYFSGIHERPVHAQLMVCVLATDSLPWTSRLKRGSFLRISQRDDLDSLTHILSLKDPSFELDLASPAEVYETLGSGAYFRRLLRLHESKSLDLST